jgi:dihydroxyacetone kinase-like protein
MDRLADIYAAQKAFLTELDSAIGDADHGTNLDRGFSAVKADLKATPPVSIEDAFKRTGMALIRSVGGASGPLYGTLFLQLSTTVKDAKAITPAMLAAGFRAATNGVKARGKTVVDQKTMVDVWEPVTQRVEAAVAEGASLEAMLTAAVEVADAQVLATIPMLATKGRASFLGERSIGHQDPGATSSALLITALKDSL